MDIDARIYEAEAALAAQHSRVENLKRDLEHEEKNLKQMKTQLQALRAHKFMQPHPISKLSTEILSLILRESAEDARQNFVLMLVCREWRYTIENDPQMWSRIAIKYPIKCWNVEVWAERARHFAQKWIARSGAALLNICLDLENIYSTAIHLQRRLYDGFLRTVPELDFAEAKDSEDLDMDLSELFEWLEELPYADLIDRLTDDTVITKGFFGVYIMEIVASLIGQDGEAMRRWKSFHLSFPDDEREDLGQIWMSLRHPTPHLHTLVLSGHEPLFPKWLNIPPTGDQIYSWSIFPELPSLVTLDVSSATNWDLLSLQYATIQRLKYSIFDYCTFLSKICRFQNLIGLAIDYFGTSRDFIFPPEVDTTLSLPLLEELVVCYYGPNIESLRFLLPKLVKLVLQNPVESARGSSPVLPMLSPRHVIFTDWKFSDLSMTQQQLLLEHCVNHFRQTEEFSFERSKEETVIKAFRALLLAPTRANLEKTDLKYVSFFNTLEEESRREFWTVEDLKNGCKS